jgi:hypothetical protein
LTPRKGFDTILAELCLFPGYPGDMGEGRHPNWPTCAWPTEYEELLEWQWRE